MFTGANRPILFTFTTDRTGSEVVQTIKTVNTVDGATEKPWRDDSS